MTPSFIRILVRRSPVFACAAAGTMICALVGCTALTPQPDGSHFYTLGRIQQEPRDPQTNGGLSVGLRVSELAEYLRRPAMVVRTSPHELHYADLHRWAERLDYGLLHALTHTLRRELPDAAISTGSVLRVVPPDVLIDLSLLACEGTAEGDAVLEATWNVFDGPEPRSSHRGHFLRRRSGWDGRDYAALARMLGELVDELAHEIAANVRASQPTAQ